MLDLDLRRLVYAKNDCEVKNPFFVTENELKVVFFFCAFIQNINLATDSFVSTSFSMSDIYIRFFIADSASFFMKRAVVK